MQDLKTRHHAVELVLAAVNKHFCFSSRSTFIDKIGRGTEMVGQLDLAIDKFVRGKLVQFCPDDLVISEEVVRNAGKLPDNYWLLDPLDGTHNTAFGWGLYGTMLAYIVRGQVQLGGILLPEYQETWTVQRGGGVWLNGCRFRPKKAEIAKPLAIGCSALRYSGQKYLLLLKALSEKGFSVRLIGSDAVAFPMIAAYGGVYVASPFEPWDVAVGTLLIEELGGRVTDFGGNDWDFTSPSLCAHRLTPAQAVKMNLSFRMAGIRK
ncbi:MAG: inositol monophosphatase family protein [Patescibacteria group bacterium]